MTRTTGYTMTLDLSVTDPSAILEAAAVHLSRTGVCALVEAARVHLDGDVSKALVALVELRPLAAAGASTAHIDCSANPRSN